MTKKYFGTDGIRGKANSFPMTAEIAMKVGMAAGVVFQRGDHRHHPGEREEPAQALVEVGALIGERARQLERQLAGAEARVVEVEGDVGVELAGIGRVGDVDDLAPRERRRQGLGREHGAQRRGGVGIEGDQSDRDLDLGALGHVEQLAGVVGSALAVDELERGLERAPEHVLIAAQVGLEERRLSLGPQPGLGGEDTEEQPDQDCHELEGDAHDGLAWRLCTLWPINAANVHRPS